MNPLRRHTVSTLFLRRTLGIFYAAEETRAVSADYENEIKTYLLSSVQPVLEEEYLFSRFLASKKTVDAFLSEEIRQPMRFDMAFCNDSDIRPIMLGFDVLLSELLSQPIFVKFLSKDPTLLNFVIGAITDRLNNAYRDYRGLFLKLVTKMENGFHLSSSLHLCFDALFRQFECLFTAFKCLRKTLIKFYFHKEKEVSDETNDQAATKHFLRSFFKRLPPFLQVFFGFVSQHRHGNNREVFREFLSVTFGKMALHLPTGLLLVSFEAFSSIDPRKISVLLGNMAASAQQLTVNETETFGRLFDRVGWKPEDFAAFSENACNGRSFGEQSYSLINLERVGLIYFLKTVQSFEIDSIPQLKTHASAVQNLAELPQTRIVVLSKNHLRECERCSKALKVAETIETLLPEMEKSESRSLTEVARRRKVSYDSSENPLTDSCVSQKAVSGHFEDHLSEEFRIHFLMENALQNNRLMTLKKIQSNLRLVHHLGANCFAIKRRLRQSLVYKFVAQLMQGGKFDFVLKFQTNSQPQDIARPYSSYDLSLLDENKEHVLRQSEMYDENYRIRKSNFKMIEIQRLKDLTGFLNRERMFWKLCIHRPLLSPVAAVLNGMEVQTANHLQHGSLSVRFGVKEDEVVQYMRTFLFTELALCLSRARHSFFIESFHWPSVFLIREKLKLSDDLFRFFLSIKSSQEETALLRKRLGLGELKYMLGFADVRFFLDRLEREARHIARQALAVQRPSFQVISKAKSDCYAAVAVHFARTARVRLSPALRSDDGALGRARAGFRSDRRSLRVRLPVLSPDCKKRRNSASRTTLPITPQNRFLNKRYK